MLWPRALDSAQPADRAISGALDRESDGSGGPRGRLFVRALAVGLVLVCVALAAASFLDARIALRFAPTANAASGDGAVTQALLREWPVRLRLAAALLAGFAALVALQQRRLAWLLGRGMSEAPGLLARGWASVAGRDGLAVAALGLVALGARLPFLSQPIRYDEALTYNEFASRSLFYAASYYPEPNNQVLYTLLVAASTHLLGAQPWALRVPALMAGLLVVPATYVLGKELFGRWTGLLAAAAVAGSSYLVEFSTLARGYTLQVLLFVVAFALVVHGLRADRAAALLLAAACGWLGFWTIPTMLYGAAAIGAWLLLARRQAGGTPRLAELAAAATLAGLLAFVVYLPIWVVSGPSALLANRFVAPLSVGDVVAGLPPSLARTWGLWMRDVPGVAGTALGLLALIATVRSRDRGGSTVPLAVPLLAACLFLVAAQRVVPFERVWLFLLPVFFILAARGAVSLIELLRVRLSRSGLALHPSWLPAIGCILVGAVMALGVLRSGSVLASDEAGAYPDAAMATQRLGTLVQRGDAVVTVVPASLPELQYYFHRSSLDASALVQPSTSGRLYVLAESEDPAAARSLLPQAGVDPSGWSAPTEVAAFGGSAIFELTRRPG